MFKKSDADSDDMQSIFICNETIIIGVIYSPIVMVTGCKNKKLYSQYPK